MHTKHLLAIATGTVTGTVATAPVPDIKTAAVSAAASIGVYLLNLLVQYLTARWNGKK